MAGGRCAVGSKGLIYRHTRRRQRGINPGAVMRITVTMYTQPKAIICNSAIVPRHSGHGVPTDFLGSYVTAGVQGFRRDFGRHDRGDHHNAGKQLTGSRICPSSCSPRGW